MNPATIRSMTPWTPISALPSLIPPTVTSRLALIYCAMVKPMVCLCRRVYHHCLKMCIHKLTSPPVPLARLVHNGAIQPHSNTKVLHHQAMAGVVDLPKSTSPLSPRIRTTSERLPVAHLHHLNVDRVPDRNLK